MGRGTKKIGYKSEEDLAKPPPPPIPKGLVMEFLIFLLLQGLDIGTNFAVNEGGRVDYLKYEELFETYDQWALPFNVSTFGQPTEKPKYNPIPYCQADAFIKGDIEGLLNSFALTLYASMLFICVAASIFLTQFGWYMMMFYNTRNNPEIINDPENQAKMVKTKFYLSLAASLLQDLPLATITAEFFLLRRGSNGLMCWYCSGLPDCDNSDTFHGLLARSSLLLTLNVIAIVMTSMWKGVSSFYRWTRIDVAGWTCFHIRAAVSVFAGMLYIITVMTPFMTVLQYQYYNLPGIEKDGISMLIDRVYIFGVLLWSLIILVVFCCPALSLIKLSD